MSASRTVAELPTHTMPPRSEPPGESGEKGESHWDEVMMELNCVYECAICLCELAPGEVTIALPCKHEFHAACIRTWLSSQIDNALQPLCPLCKETVPLSQPASKLSEGFYI